MNAENQFYPSFAMTQIKAESPDDVPEISADLIRVELPAAAANSAAMKEKGFSFGDRTLGVAINLKKIEDDLDKLIRFEVRPAREEDMGAVLQIALSSFPTDRRFHVKPRPDRNVADEIIRDWVARLTHVYVCVHKDAVAGFLDLEPVGERDSFIHLAAVAEKYRAAGAALSLYAYAVKAAREEGKARVLGRISSTNTAVMNLYARLGGAFSDPVDVFLKDEQ